MLDHVALNVSDLEASKRFYEQALRPLGYRVVFEVDGWVAMGEEGPELGLVPREPVGGAHIAFQTPDRATVDAFYEAAIAAGGGDNGPPGIRTHYHEHYYAAYVTDPDGHNVEAVHQHPA